MYWHIGLYLPFRWNILILAMTAMTEVLWHAALCNVSCFLLIIWPFHEGSTGLQAQSSYWCYDGAEGRVGLKHPWYMVIEGVSDTYVLSQCAQKRALQRYKSGIGHHLFFFFFCWAVKSSCLLRSGSRAAHEAPFLGSVHVSWVNQYQRMELFRLTEVIKELFSRGAGESGDEQFATR